MEQARLVAFMFEPYQPTPVFAGASLSFVCAPSATEELEAVREKPRLICWGASALEKGQPPCATGFDDPSNCRGRPASIIKAMQEGDR